MVNPSSVALFRHIAIDLSNMYGSALGAGVSGKHTAAQVTISKSIAYNVDWGNQPEEDAEDHAPDLAPAALRYRSLTIHAINSPVTFWSLLAASSYSTFLHREQRISLHHGPSDILLSKSFIGARFKRASQQSPLFHRFATYQLLCISLDSTDTETQNTIALLDLRSPQNPHLSLIGIPFCAASLSIGISPLFLNHLASPLLQKDRFTVCVVGWTSPAIIVLSITSLSLVRTSSSGLFVHRVYLAEPTSPSFKELGGTVTDLPTRPRSLSFEPYFSIEHLPQRPGYLPRLFPTKTASTTSSLEKSGPFIPGEHVSLPRVIVVCLVRRVPFTSYVCEVPPKFPQPGLVRFQLK
ncbi:hypothetical protein CC2G_012590 [Coprinopsis cinerea AmutBmut pab1-1]|nr:hypothetical protein CC2G_012590 [Coprinopsis cinerea AmutBmut pab1-1]